MLGAPSEASAAERRQREVRTYPQDERTVLFAARQILAEEGGQVLVRSSRSAC